MGPHLRRACRAITLSIALSASACAVTHERGGATEDTGPLTFPDAGPRPDVFLAPPDAWRPPFVIAPHGPAAFVPDQGGARMSAPELVIITYADDPDRPSLEAHARWMASSSWLPTVGAEYGVRSLSILAMIERTDAAPASITGDGIAALINQGIADHSLPTASTGVLGDALYIVYFPPRSTIDDPQLGTSCVSFGAYHNEASTPDGRTFAYAVIPSCTATDPTLTDLQNEEIAITHEVIEAATDPRPFTGPAFAFDPMSPTPSPWLFAGAELADLCQYRTGPDAYFRDSGFAATRVWSNAAALANDRDPCVPNDGIAPYAAISISPADAQPASAGETVTFDVAAWSSAPASDLQLFAFGSGGTDGFSFVADATLDRGSVNNGDHATLRVTIPFGATSGQYGLVYVSVNDGLGNSDLVPVVVYTF